MLWQNIIVAVIVALAAGITLWRLYRNMTGKSSCGCGGGCSGCGGSSRGGRGSGGGAVHIEDLRGGGGCCGH